MAIKRKILKKRTGSTTAIIIVNGKPVSKKKSDASKKGWVARRKNMAKKTMRKKNMVRKTNRKKVMPGDHVTKTNPRKVAAGHNPMEKKRSLAAKKVATRRKNARKTGSRKKVVTGKTSPKRTLRRKTSKK